MSWRWVGGEEDPGESLVEIELRPIAQGTELTFTHSRLHDKETRRSHEEGWNGAFDKLERQLLASAEGVVMPKHEFVSAEQGIQERSIKTKDRELR
jgi:Activator of Hsp90 ATPase homolog 1-like protein